jgi:integrase/recombinase XerD
MQLRFRYLVEDVDRYGNIRLYVRVPGRQKVRIRAPFGTDEFITAYNVAVSDHVLRPRQTEESKPGSFRWLCVQYYTSPTFGRLDPATQTWRRRALDHIALKHGYKPVALMEARHVRQLRDERGDKPSVANKRIKALQALFGWAMEADLVKQDPTLGVRKIKYATTGFHTWTLDEIEQFKARHPIGSRARLALALMLHTTGRREDAVRLGPQHVRDGRVRFRQAKNEHRNPVDIDIPAYPDLLATIASTPSGHLTFLVTANGKPFSALEIGFETSATRPACHIARRMGCARRRQRHWRRAAPLRTR